MQKNSFTVKDFCYSENLGKSTFYKLLNQGLGPRIMKVGNKTLISREAADEWRRSFEQQLEKSEEK